MHRIFLFCHVAILQFLILPHYGRSELVIVLSYSSTSQSENTIELLWFYHVSLRTHNLSRSAVYIASHWPTDRLATVIDNSHLPPEFSHIWQVNFELPEPATTEQILAHPMMVSFPAVDKSMLNCQNLSDSQFSSSWQVNFELPELATTEWVLAYFLPAPLGPAYWIYYHGIWLICHILSTMLVYTGVHLPTVGHRHLQTTHTATCIWYQMVYF